MDNLTHALVGLLCAEAVVRVAERGRTLDPWCRTAIYAFAIVGNNLPDLDFCYASISGKTFGYLLQHRGYTHTVPAAFGFALAMLAALWGLCKRRGKRLLRAEWQILAVIALVSPLLHLIMDFANNYGVHPFWPVYSGWFYGDALFIVEPSLWLVILAPLSLSHRSKWLRVGSWLVLSVTLVALYYRPLVPRGHAVFLSLLTLLLLGLARRIGPRTRSLLAGSCFVLLITSFVIGSQCAKSIAREQAALAFPGARTLDIVATPMPANPFCWSVLIVQLDGASYVVRLGRAATWPGWLDVKACPSDTRASPGAPRHRLTGPMNERLSLQSEYRVPLAELLALLGGRCEARAFARFARVPYVTEPAPSGARVLGDLRYDRNPGLDFSDLSLPERERAEQCPKHVPSWLPPRKDLLSESRH